MKRCNMNRAKEIDRELDRLDRVIDLAKAFTGEGYKSISFNGRTGCGSIDLTDKEYDQFIQKVIVDRLDERQTLEEELETL